MLIQLSPNAQLYPLREVVVAGGTLTVLEGEQLALLFADLVGSTPISNPVQLDSSGSCPAFYAAVGTYDLELRSPEGYLPRTWTVSNSGAALQELELFQGTNTYMGLPLEGGLVWSFLPGSFSKLAPLYDEEGDPLPNPVGINSNGTLQHRLFLPLDTGRNLVLTKLDGTTVIGVFDILLEGN